jgi:BCCT, betaine/carnitine/choline family transporter
MQTLGETHYNNTQHFAVDGSELCYDVPQQDVVVDGEVVFTNYLPGVTPVCVFDPATSSESIFRVLYSFTFSESFGGQGLGPFLSVVFLVCCAFYFVTSSGTASLIVDGLASNGRKNRHWARRLFWAITVGALTSVLLSAGGADALYAVQAASIVCGLPVAIIMCYLIQTITLFCRAADGTHEEGDYQFPIQPEFETPIYGGVFNVLEYAASWGKVNQHRVDLGMHEATKFHVAEFVKGLCFPAVPLNQVLASTYPENPKTNFAAVACYTLCYFGWIILSFVSTARPGFAAVAWTLFVLSGIILAMIRAGFRTRHNLRSNVVADFVAAWFFWPQVFVQMRMQSLIVAAAAAREKTVKVDKEEIGFGLSFDV